MRDGTIGKGGTTKAALTLCAIALWLAALAPSALAAPTHPRTPALDVEGLNRACGTAVDSEGNVYASSAGEGKVKVFGPSDHATPIAEIANANEPCALAVDSKGTLLVSEQATGNVVAYGPGAYPFSGPPAYGPPVTVDASGDAVGIALDRTDDRLYVAEGDHVAVYSSEIQQVGIFEATGGTYKLKFKGEETSSLPFDATAAEVKAALEALGTIGAGEVSVSSGKRVTFARGLGYTDVPQLEDVSSLQGNEIQKVTVKATTGTYKLKFEGEETGSIAFNAKASEPGGPVDSVQEALEALASIAPGDVTVAGGPGDATGTKPYLVTFKGAYAAANVGTMSSSASLGGGSAAVASASQFQRITVAATGGTYTLKFPNVGGQETAPIAFNATAAEVQAALEALSNIAPGDVTVSGGPGDAEGTRPYLVHFEGAYAASDIAQMGRSNTGLTGTASISRILDGASHGTSTPASGGLGAGETQEVKVANALSGTYKLKFEGEETAAIPFNATAAEVQAALEALAKIATGDVAVFPNGTPTFASRNYAAGFGGAYAATDVPQLTAVSSLGPGGAAVTASTTAAGWSGQALKGQLTEATGVAPYTNTSAQANPRLNLAVADGAGDEVEIFSGSGPATLKSRKAITGIDHDEDPGTAEREFSFGAAGAYLAVDPGNEDAPTQGCAQVQVGGKDQACTQGHFFLHDAGNDAIYEFDATGELFAQVTAAGLSADAGPTQVAVERSGGANDGTLYAGSGSGAAAKLLAFAPVLKPSRTPLGEPFSKVLTGAVAVATDCNGYVYVAAQSSVRVYSPAGAEVTSFAEANAPSDLAVDCAGNVYVVDTIAPTPQMTYYSPSSPSPPSGATTYARHEPSLVTAAGLQGVAVNPANGHVFVLGSQLFGQVIREFGPPSGGSKAEGECGAGLDVTTLRLDIDVYGKTGNVYVSGNSEFVYVLKCGKEPKDAELIREIKGGGGCSSGKWGSNPGIAVDQSNGHFIEYSIGQPGAAAREYDAVGACLAEFGTFSSSSGSYRLAIDNSCALHGLTEETTPTCEDTYPSSGNAYVAYDGPDNNVQPYDVTAFGPLGYPEVVVDPEEFKLTVKKTGTGTGKVTSSPAGIDCGSDCDEEYEEGEEVTLSATPDGGSTFASWSGSGCSGTGTCVVTMSAAKEVTATFDLESTPEFTLSITNAGTGTGTVKCKVGAGSPGACAAKYPEGTQLSLIAEAAAGSEFASYSSGTGSAAACTISPCNFTLNANSSVTANFNLIPRTLSITSAGTGTGEVKCKFNGGAAGACTSPQPNGTTVEIIATANAGSEFAGFSSGTGSASSCLTSPCSFTITANSSVTANFNLIPRTLSITSAGTGTGEVKCKFNGGSVGACTSPQPNGTSVEIIATANSGSTFAGFSSGTGSASSCSISPCSFTITANSSVTANFNEESTTPEFLLTVDTEGTGTGTVTSDKGTISCGAFCSDEYPEGTVVVLTATPASGSVFYSWKYCDSGGVNGRKCTITVNKAKTVKAVFTTTHALEVSRAGSGLGKVQSSPGGILCLSNCSETTAAFKEGTKVTLKQTPAKHFHFVKWLGDCTGSGACEVTMGEDHSAQAEFAEDPKHLLTLTKSGGGQGTVKSSVAGINCGATCSTMASAYYQGELVELTATPGKGSTFGGWSGSGCSGTGTCTVTMSEAKSVTAEFK